TNYSSFKIYTVAGGQVQFSYSDINVSTDVSQTKTARIAVVPATAANATSPPNGGQPTPFAIGTVSLTGVTSTTASGPASLVRGGQIGTILFTGIKDSMGNTVPDGTLIVASAAGYYGPSIGGTIVGGTVSPTNSQFKVFTVVN